MYGQNLKSQILINLNIFERTRVLSSDTNIDQRKSLGNPIFISRQVNQTKCCQEKTSFFLIEYCIVRFTLIKGNTIFLLAAVLYSRRKCKLIVQANTLTLSIVCFIHSYIRGDRKEVGITLVIVVCIRGLEIIQTCLLMKVRVYCFINLVLEGKKKIEEEKTFLSHVQLG